MFRFRDLFLVLSLTLFLFLGSLSFAYTLTFPGGVSDNWTLVEEWGYDKPYWDNINVSAYYEDENLHFGFFTLPAYLDKNFVGFPFYVTGSDASFKHISEADDLYLGETSTPGYLSGFTYARKFGISSEKIRIYWMCYDFRRFGYYYDGSSSAFYCPNYPAGSYLHWHTHYIFSFGVYSCLKLTSSGISGCSFGYPWFGAKGFYYSGDYSSPFFEVNNFVMYASKVGYFDIKIMFVNANGLSVSSSLTPYLKLAHSYAGYYYTYIYNILVLRFKIWDPSVGDWVEYGVYVSGDSSDYSAPIFEVPILDIQKPGLVPGTTECGAYIYFKDPNTGLTSVEIPICPSDRTENETLIVKYDVESDQFIIQQGASYKFGLADWFSQLGKYFYKYYDASAFGTYSDGDSVSNQGNLVLNYVDPSGGTVPVQIASYNLDPDYTAVVPADHKGLLLSSYFAGGVSLEVWDEKWASAHGYDPATACLDSSRYTFEEDGAKVYVINPELVKVKFVVYDENFVLMPTTQFSSSLGTAGKIAVKIPTNLYSWKIVVDDSYERTCDFRLVDSDGWTDFSTKNSDPSQFYYLPAFQTSISGSVKYVDKIITCNWTLPPRSYFDWEDDLVQIVELYVRIMPDGSYECGTSISGGADVFPSPNTIQLSSDIKLAFKVWDQEKRDYLYGEILPDVYLEYNDSILDCGFPSGTRFSSVYLGYGWYCLDDGAGNCRVFACKINGSQNYVNYFPYRDPYLVPVEFNMPLVGSGLVSYFEFSLDQNVEFNLNIDVNRFIVEFNVPGSKITVWEYNTVDGNWISYDFNASFALGTRFKVGVEWSFGESLGLFISSIDGSLKTSLFYNPYYAHDDTLRRVWVSSASEGVYFYLFSALPKKFDNQSLGSMAMTVVFQDKLASKSLPIVKRSSSDVMTFKQVVSDGRLFVWVEGDPQDYLGSFFALDVMNPEPFGFTSDAMLPDGTGFEFNLRQVQDYVTLWKFFVSVPKMYSELGFEDVPVSQKYIAQARCEAIPPFYVKDILGFGRVECEFLDENGQPIPGLLVKRAVSFYDYSDIVQDNFRYMRLTYDQNKGVYYESPAYFDEDPSNFDQVNTVYVKACGDLYGCRITYFEFYAGEVVGAPSIERFVLSPNPLWLSGDLKFELEVLDDYNSVSKVLFDFDISGLPVCSSEEQGAKNTKCFFVRNLKTYTLSDFEKTERGYYLTGKFLVKLCNSESADISSCASTGDVVIQLPASEYADSNVGLSMTVTVTVQSSLGTISESRSVDLRGSLSGMYLPDWWRGFMDRMKLWFTNPPTFFEDLLNWVKANFAIFMLLVIIGLVIYRRRSGGNMVVISRG